MNKGIKKIRMNGKNKEHTMAIIRSQALDLAIKKRIKTTLHKAKLLSRVFDRLVSHAKKGTKSGENYIRSFFSSNDRSIKRFMSIVNEYMHDRSSGYTRVIKTTNRLGDNAKMAYIMFSSITNFSNQKKSIFQKSINRDDKK